MASTWAQLLTAKNSLDMSMNTCPQAFKGCLIVQQAFAVAHVRDLAPLLRRHQHIVGLQVPMHYAPLMQG